MLSASGPRQKRAYKARNASLRNGSGVVPAMSHREIANELGISYARVEQIEKRALKKLKTLLLEQGLELKMILIVGSFQFKSGDAWDWKEDDWDCWD